MKHALLAVVLALGCSKSAGTDTRSAAAGSERGDCYGNGTCNQGLICLSNLCVRPPPADCAKVAKALDYLTLGNYASMQERAAFDEKMAAECRAANLTKEEGDCILSAKSRQQLAECPKPLALGDCEKMAAYVMKEIAPREPELRDTMRGPEGMIARCRELGLTREQETCVMRAHTLKDLQLCVPDR